MQLARSSVVYSKLVRAMERDQKQKRKSLMPKSPDRAFFAHAAFRVGQLRRNEEASKRLKQLPERDAFPGDNAHQCKHKSLETSRKLCLRKGYGGFVVFQGTAYFRRQSGSDLIPSAEHNDEAVLHVAPHRKPFRVTIAGKPGAAPRKGQPPSAPDPREGPRPCPVAARAESPTIAAYDRFIRTLDESLVSLRNDFPNLVKIR